MSLDAHFAKAPAQEKNHDASMAFQGEAYPKPGVILVSGEANNPPVTNPSRPSYPPRMEAPAPTQTLQSNNENTNRNFNQNNNLNQNRNFNQNNLTEQTSVTDRATARSNATGGAGGSSSIRENNYYAPGLPSGASGNDTFGVSLPFGLGGAMFSVPDKDVEKSRNAQQSIGRACGYSVDAGVAAANVLDQAGRNVLTAKQFNSRPHLEIANAQHGIADQLAAGSAASVVDCVPRVPPIATRPWGAADLQGVVAPRSGDGVIRRR